VRISRCHPNRREKGDTTVEFALIAIALLGVIFGIIEISRMALIYNAVANAARAGTRYAIVHGGLRTGSGVTGPSGPGSTTEVENVVRNFAATAPLPRTAPEVTITYPGGSNLPGNVVQVSVVYPYVPFVRFYNFSTLRLGSTSRGVIVF
jgi:TadE-like protein